LSKLVRIMMLSLSILFAVNLASPSFADIPRVENVVVYESGGSTFLNITVYHNTETSSHYVNIIEVAFGTNTTDWNIDPMALSLASTFNVTYDVGPVAGNPTATVRANCIQHGWSSQDWSGPIPEFQTTVLLSSLLIMLIAAIIFRSDRLIHAKQHP
jgi:hypothetical protein